MKELCVYLVGEGGTINSTGFSHLNPLKATGGPERNKGHVRPVLTAHSPSGLIAGGEKKTWLHSSRALRLFEHKCISSALIGNTNTAKHFLFRSLHRCTGADLVRDFGKNRNSPITWCDNTLSGIAKTRKHINQRVWAGARTWHPCTRGQSVSMWPVFTLTPAASPQVWSFFTPAA